VNTLLFRLCGPLQAWGTQSRFSVRETGREPSKSGVIGLICAALGRPRTTSVDDLAALRMGVRVDREGELLRDFQTAINVAKASGGIKETEISERYYLADADFLVGMEGGDLSLLAACHEALARPKWALFLGRKGCPPGLPIFLPNGLMEGVRLEQALERYRWNPHYGQAEPESLRLVLETPFGIGEEVRTDQPVGAAFATRRFTLRHFTTRFILLKEGKRCTSPP